MPIHSEHPEYVKHAENWKKVRDAVEGDLAIRRNITDYLPVPPGLSTASEVLETGKRVSTTRYHFYAQMAEWPEIVAPTLNGILGLIHEKKPEVELPKDMDDLWEKVTSELFQTGRCILLGEIYADGSPRLCQYPTESMINWRLRPKRDGGEPDMIVFREFRLEPDPEDEYKYKEVSYYRLLRLEDGFYTVRVFRINKEGKAEIVPFEDGEEWVQPQLLGKRFDFIPLNVINSMDLGFDFGPIPMLPMTNRAISIFRRSADYNRSLYIKGDPQVVLSGVDEDDIPTEIGGGAVWAFSNPMARASYLDIDGQGIPLMRQSIQDQFQRFTDEVGMLLEGSSTGYESGEALRRRQALRQVTVKSVIINAAEGMQAALRNLARMKGKPQSEIHKIIFRPNIDFNEPIMTGQELRELITSKVLGAPLSEQSLHDLMRRRQVTEMSYVEERRLLDEENAEKLQADIEKLEKMNEVSPDNSPSKNNLPALPGLKGRPRKTDPRSQM